MEAPILFRFIVLLAVLPWFVVLTNRLRDSHEYVLLAVTFYLLCAAELATFLERVFGLEVMDTVQHGLYGLGAVTAVIAVVRLRASIVRRRAAA